MHTETPSVVLAFGFDSARAEEDQPRRPPHCPILFSSFFASLLPFTLSFIFIFIFFSLRPTRQPASTNMDPDQLAGYYIGYAVLAALWVKPLGILWLISLCLARRRDDPARAGIAWMKAITPFWSL